MAWILWVCACLVVFGSCLDEIVEFKIAFPEEQLEDLKGRLQRARLPQPIENRTSWKRGASVSYMEEILEYWKNEYDWRKQEEYLNSFPQFLTQIDGIDVHFVHVRSSFAHAEPLLIVHGWPGSFMEFHKVIPLLSNPPDGRLPFHVICPSLPGYGFTKVPPGGALNQRQTALLFIKLMKKLKYDLFWAQGGDWGSLVTTQIALAAPGSLKGLHLNFVVAPLPSSFSGLLWTFYTFFLFPRFSLSDSDYQIYSHLTLRHAWDLSGYFHLQATRPQTLGYLLNDSPIGLAAYIIEKFHEWGDCEPARQAPDSPKLCSRFTKDELLTNVMLYWISQTPATTVNYYYECFEDQEALREQWFVGVPTGFASFPGEKYPVMMKALAEWRYNVRRWSVMDKGGHFAALEEPELLVSEIRGFREQIEEESKKVEF